VTLRADRGAVVFVSNFYGFFLHGLIFLLVGSSNANGREDGVVQLEERGVRVDDPRAGELMAPSRRTERTAIPSKSGKGGKP